MLSSLLELFHNFWMSIIAHPGFYGFLSIALPLIGLLALDHSRHARAVAQEEAPKQRFLAPYRDAEGMPVYFDLDTYDPESPAYSTRRKRYQSRTVSQ